MTTLALARAKGHIGICCPEELSRSYVELVQFTSPHEKDNLLIHSQLTTTGTILSFELRSVVGSCVVTGYLMNSNLFSNMVGWGTQNIHVPKYSGLASLLQQ